MSPMAAQVLAASPSLNIQDIKVTIHDISPNTKQETKVMYKTIFDLNTLNDEQLLEMMHNGQLLPHTLESQLKDLQRAVHLRRQFVGKSFDPISCNSNSKFKYSFSF
jgi:hypothetical protein